MITFYGYAKCGTCRKAKTFLDELGVPMREKDITRTPPPKSVLRSILRAGTYTRAQLFNTSGKLYREMRLKHKVAALSDGEVVDLLAAHGKLVKRPIVVDGSRHTVGFDEKQFRETWGQSGA